MYVCMYVCMYIYIYIYIYVKQYFYNHTYPRTSLLSPCRTLGYLWRALPCRQRAPPRPAEVVRDTCCRLNEDALRRCLADFARSLGTKEGELLWATWENRGPGTSPPLAILFDHEHRKLVIAVRGTMDVKDCIADLGAAPAFFDPLGQAGPSDRCEPPFDQDTIYYTILYYTILYYTILYYTILYYTRTRASSRTP